VLIASPAEWFWTLLDTARPSLLTLSHELEQLPRERLVEFACAYRDASEQICDFWLGPTVDRIAFSEDDTEEGVIGVR
jgi:hypothetical protein